MAYPYNRRGSGRTYRMSSIWWIFPQWTDEKMKCVVIDNNEDYVTKSKLTIAVKALAKYNDKSRVAVKQTNKQTNRLRDTETGKH